MCGRMNLPEAPTWKQLHYYYSTFSGPQFSNKNPKGDVAPTDGAPIVALRRGERRMALARWWLVPQWCRSLEEAKRSMFNCRDDNLQRSFERLMSNQGIYGPFIGPFSSGRRCLVPVNGYYEYKDGRPYIFTLVDRPIFSIAGIWDWNENIKTEEWPDGVLSFTMITTEPNPVAAPIHNRMPVILNPDQYDTWLNPHLDTNAALDMLRPYQGDDLRVEAQRIKADNQLKLI